jgi:hypothetical protein
VRLTVAETDSHKRTHLRENIQTIEGNKDNYKKYIIIFELQKFKVILSLDLCLLAPLSLS